MSKIFLSGQEDLHGFHGKPVAANAKDEIIEEINKQIVRSSLVKLSPPAPEDDTKPTNLSNITLASPPDYKVGQMVSIFGLVCSF